jgi:hypothetical protein
MPMEEAFSKPKPDSPDPDELQNPRVAPQQPTDQGPF